MVSFTPVLMTEDHKPDVPGRGRAMEDIMVSVVPGQK